MRAAASGREIRAKRISDTVAVKREIALPTSALKKFVGTYQLRPGFDLVIKLDGEHLVLHPTGQSSDRLYAETENTFFSKVGGQGEITHLTLNQGQFNGDAQRM